MTADPTTAAIEAQNDERDQLRAENQRLSDEVATLRRFLDAEKAQCDGMGRRNLEAMAILVGSYPGGFVERARAVATERERLRALVEEACGELDDTGGELAAQRATEIRREAGIDVAVGIEAQS